MKNFIFLVAVCLVAVQAFPDEHIKLEPDTIVKELEEATTVETPTTPKKPIKSQGTVADRTKLVNDLFKEYNKGVNPDDINLKFGVTLIDLHVLETENAVESYVWLVQNWTDARLKWNPEEYGGTELVRLESNKIWKPDFTLYNSADTVNMVNCWESNVLIYSNGNILWVPPCKMTSSCALNLRKEPYGKNVCTWKFGSWTFDGLTMDVQFNKDMKSMDITHMENTSGFEVVENVAERHERYYSCCPEPYLDLSFNLTLKRIPGEELFKRM